MELMDLSSWKVLAVDDEPDSLEVLAEALGMHDATVHCTSSGQEALALLQTLRPTLVVTDLSMPEMDGYQLLYRIRRNEELKATPVIALTAHAMVGDRERILEAGFNGYISKPLRIATLVPIILESLPSLKPGAVPTVAVPTVAVPTVAVPTQAPAPQPPKPAPAPVLTPEPIPPVATPVPVEVVPPRAPAPAPAPVLTSEPIPPVATPVPVDVVPPQPPKPEPAPVPADVRPPQAPAPAPALTPEPTPPQAFKPDPTDAAPKQQP